MPPGKAGEGGGCAQYFHQEALHMPAFFSYGWDETHAVFLGELYVFLQITFITLQQFQQIT